MGGWVGGWACFYLCLFDLPKLLLAQGAWVGWVGGWVKTYLCLLDLPKLLLAHRLDLLGLGDL